MKVLWLCGPAQEKWSFNTRFFPVGFACILCSGRYNQRHDDRTSRSPFCRTPEGQEGPPSRYGNEAGRKHGSPRAPHVRRLRQGPTQLVLHRCWAWNRNHGMHLLPDCQGVWGMNHKDTCDRKNWHYSGTGYNRVKVCACGAEDHDPQATIEHAETLSRVVESMKKSRNPL